MREIRDRWRQLARGVISLSLVMALSVSVSISTSRGAPPRDLKAWRAELRAWEQLGPPSSRALTSLAQRGPRFELLRAIAQRRWGQGLSLALRGAQDRRSSVRHMAYFALSQLEIKPREWALDVTRGWGSSVSDRVALIEALGESTHPSALQIIAPYLSMREAPQVRRAALLARWKWAHRGHYAPLDSDQARMLTSKRVSSQLRPLAAELVALTLRAHGDPSRAISPPRLSAQVAKSLTQRLTRLLNRGELEPTPLTLSVSSTRPQQLLTWWEVGKLNGHQVTTLPQNQARVSTERRRASAQMVSARAPEALHSLILTRALRRLELRHLYGFKLRSSYPEGQRHKPRRRQPTAAQRHQSAALSAELDATISYLSGLLTRGRPEAPLIRSAREGVRLTREWEASLKRLTEDQAPALHLSLIEVERLRCHLSALIDLKRRRPRALSLCTDRAELTLLTTELMLRLTQKAPTFHRLRSIETWFKRAESFGEQSRDASLFKEIRDLVQIELVRGLRGVKLLGRRSAQVRSLLKIVLSHGGEARRIALEIATSTGFTGLVEEALTLSRETRPEVASDAESTSTLKGITSPPSVNTIKDLKWGMPSIWSQVVFTFSRGAVTVKLSPKSFHGARALQRLVKRSSSQRSQIRDQNTLREKDAQLRRVSDKLDGVVHKASQTWVSLLIPRLGRSIAPTRRALDSRALGERRLIDPAYYLGERWALSWAGREPHDLSPGLVFSRGALTPPHDGQNLMGEVTQGQDVLMRLGVGDRLLSVTLER